MKRPAQKLLTAALLFGFASSIRGQHAPEVLTNASAILALSPDRALKGVPISVRGVVTVAERYWEGRFFVQDDSAGVFVDNISPQQPSPGDVVEVRGVSHPGAFAPVISKPTWKIVGRTSLPPAKPVSIERLISGSEDGQRIEVTGTIRTVAEEHSLLSLEVVSAGCRFHVFAQPPPELQRQNLIGAHARFRGTAAPYFNAQLRQLINVKVFMPLVEDLMIDQREGRDPFNQPFLPLTSIGQYRRDYAPGSRIHVRGIVTYQRVGEELFITDDNGSLRVKCVSQVTFPAGHIIEAAGFPNLDHLLPVMEDAICRETGEPALEVAPRRPATEELEAGLYHANLITLRAKLLDRGVRRSLDRANQRMQVKTIMMFQSDNLVFSGQMESSEEPAKLVSVPLGSTVEVTGICLSEINDEGKLKLLELLIPESRPLIVLQTPSWLTPKRLSVSLAILFVVMVVAVSWTVIISRKNSTLSVLIREKEQAQRQLQLARDQLEERVRERTEQLKVQVTGRKESELQFKTVLNERTRLAQELHDTLEQTLTGIALQMDTARRLVDQNPEEANQHLKLARTLVGQGQDEARRSVWDLRSRSREEFDLPSAVTVSARHLTDGTGICASVNTRGRVRKLPDLLEDNLLRIAQEALTNVIKHAGPTTAKIELDYRSRDVRLTIQDHGRGFCRADCDGPLDGHFGLLGISERVKRINGRVNIESTPGKGTFVRVDIPIEPETEYQLPTFAGLDV